MSDETRDSKADGSEVIPPENVRTAKQFRKDLDATLQQVKAFRDGLGRSEAARHASICVTAIEDSIMRLGMVLKEINPGNNPYPQSYNPDSPVVEPTADGLKL